MRNIAEDLKSANHKYQAKVISKRIITEATLDDDLRHKFNIKAVADEPTGDTTEPLLYEVKIVHIADGQPIQFEERWVDARRVPHFMEQDFSRVNTSDYLIEKIPLERGSYTIQALAAPVDIANALQIEQASPTLVLSRKTFSAGQVLTVVKMWHAGDRYQFAGEL